MWGDLFGAAAKGDHSDGFEDEGLKFRSIEHVYVIGDYFFGFPDFCPFKDSSSFKKFRRYMLTRISFE